MVTNKILQQKGSPGARGHGAAQNFAARSTKQSPYPGGEIDWPLRTESQIYEELHRSQQADAAENEVMKNFEVMMFQANKDIGYVRNTPDGSLRKSLSRFEDQQAAFAAEGKRFQEHQHNHNEFREINQNQAKLWPEKDKRNRTESQSLVFSNQAHTSGHA